MIGHNPYFKIETQGDQPKNITTAIQPSLVTLSLHDRSGNHTDSLELDLADDGSLPVPKEGNRLSLEIGYCGGQHRARQSFVVDQVEHSGPPAHIQLSATTVDFTSQERAPRERSHGSLTIGELIEKLASEHGYKSKVISDELANVRLGHIDQPGQSDLSLAHEIARSHNAFFKPVDGIWFVRSYDSLGDPAAIIWPADVSSWRAHFLARSSYASVVAHYHDFDLAQRVPVMVGDGQPQMILDATYSDADTALWQAKSAMSRARRESRKLTLQMPGRPDLASQQVIRLEGFRERVDCEWLITEVTHTISSRGYSSSVECEGV